MKWVDLIKLGKISRLPRWLGLQLLQLHLLLLLELHQALHEPIGRAWWWWDCRRPRVPSVGARIRPSLRSDSNPAIWSLRCTCLRSFSCRRPKVKHTQSPTLHFPCLPRSCPWVSRPRWSASCWMHRIRASSWLQLYPSVSRRQPCTFRLQRPCVRCRPSTNDPANCSFVSKLPSPLITLSLVMVILFCLPVDLSCAETLRMPLASMSNVTSIWGSPLGAGGMPDSSNLPSRLLSFVIARSPS